MDKQYKKYLGVEFKAGMANAFSDFKPYKPDRYEKTMFHGGSDYYRKVVSGGLSEFMILQPGEGFTRNYSVLLGWSFVGEIRPYNYLERVRETENQVEPRQEFDSGFYELDEIEGKAACYGQVIPSPWDALDDPKLLSASRQRQQEIQAQVERLAVQLTEADIECAVRISVLGTLKRLKVAAPPFFRKVEFVKRK